MDQRKKQLSWATLRVGLFMTGAIVVIFVAVLFAGDIERPFTSRVTVYATFDDVRGLRPDAPVWISGVEIGSVRSLHFTPENIKVTMSLDRKALSRIKTDSRARILTLGLLGDTYVDITPGSKEAPVIKPEETLRGGTQPGINEQVEGIINLLKNKKGTIGRLLEEDTVYEDLVDALRDVKQFIAKLEASKGTVNNLIADKSLYRNVNAAAEKLNAVLEKINTGEGTAGSLISDKELKQELRSTLKEVNALVKDIKQNPKKYFKFSVF
jgi:phospholipid/cholesterol/gamma-HCH transport system substrate-binding protein